MAGIYRPEPERVVGWGVGHQGENTFNTSAMGFDHYATPYGMPRPRHKPASILSDSDSDGDDLDRDAVYGELDLGKVLGQQLAVWSHRSPDTVCLFTPIPGDSFYSLVHFARTDLQFDSSVDKIMVLLPGHSRPLEMEDVFVVRPGTAILVTPRYEYMVTMEVKQLGQKFDLVVNMTMTVLELKGRLETERGYPANRIDFLYRDRPMENARYLFEYRVAHGSTLFVLLSLSNNILVHVDTFWGKGYHLYVDACTTGLSIIASILRRTVSQGVTDVVRLYELFLPKHTLVLYLGSRVVDWNTCLGFYSIEEGHVLRMSTIGLAHDMAIQKVPVILDNGRFHTILASKFDRWSAVVLKLHGMTGYPVNLMRLIRHGNSTVDFSDSVGYISHNSPAVKLDVSAVRTDDDLLYGVPLKFRFGHGVTELLKVAPSRTIKSVKDTLERVGVPNASLYDLEVDGCRLPNNKRVVDVIDEYKTPVELVLRQYPVFVHGPQNIIYKMLAHTKESLATFLMRIRMKTGLADSDYSMLVCGMPLEDNPSMPVFHSRIAVRSSLFLTHRKKYRSFFILHGEWLTKLKLPEYPKLNQLKDMLWKERNVPEGGLASIGNFLQWFYAAKNRDNAMAAKVHPSKTDGMGVYEASDGKRVMQMKVEQPPRHQGRPQVKKRLETDLAELEKLVRYQDALRVRASSLPPARPKKNNRGSRLPRHVSAGGQAHDRHKDYYRRKNKMAALQEGGQKSNRNRQVKTEGDAELVFALRHDAGYTTLVPSGKRGMGRIKK